MNKLKFVEEVRSGVIDWLAAASTQSQRLFAEYFDNGYNSGGSNEITDEDVASLGLTAVNISSAMALLENYNKFISGTSPANSVFRITINQVKS